MTETKSKVVNVKAEPNIYEKIFNIQQDIHTVVKSGFNDFHKYSFAKERDVIAEVKPLLGREGVVITHTVLKEEEVPHGVSGSGGQKYLTKLTIKFRLTNVKDTNDFLDVDAIGSGQDGEDKGVPKAYTMALKYMLSKTFLIETDNDAEQDKGKGKGKSDAGTNDSKFATAMTMIKGSRNIDGLIEYTENLEGTKSTFTAAQKNQLKKAVNDRVAELQK